MKTCSKCRETKSLDDFYRHRRPGDGRRSECKVCNRTFPSKSREANRETQRKWRAANPEAHRRIYMKDKPRLARALRARMITALKQGYRSGSAVRDLGCSIDELKVHLESKFQPGMSWSNWSRSGWHIDHILPLAGFDLQDRDQVIKAVHYTNLQPLWATDNLRKGAAIQ